MLRPQCTFLIHQVQCPQMINTSKGRGRGPGHCAIFRGKNPHEGKVLNIQNLPYLWNMKTHVVFFIFHFVQIFVFPNECPGLCRHIPGHSLGKNFLARNEKRKKLRRFSYSKSMANFEYLRLCLHGDFCL